MTTFCKYDPKTTLAQYLDKQLTEIKNATAGEKVLLALSGGVDSSVCAALLSKAIPGKLTCIFVDTGLMRHKEGDQIESVFGKKDLNFIRVDAENRFLTKLKGITDPEQKRKIIGAEFIEVFKEQAKVLGGIKFLGQGTIYPDILESNGVKSHHNVGGLPEVLGFKDLVEPLKYLYKDEVREIGRMLGLPDFLVNRQPFPGPGLGVRVIGEITKDKLDTLRLADKIFREELDNHKIEGQYFAVHTGVNSVGVKNNKRVYGHVIALRAVLTKDFMSGKIAELPYDVLNKVVLKITNEVEGVSRIVYDITPKPPATIEWE